MTPEARRKAPDSILARAPEIRYSPRDMKDILNEPMTWDIRSGVVTVESYVARNLTAVSHLVGVTPEVRTDFYLQPSQLNKQESANLAKAVLGDKDDGLVDQDGLSMPQIVNEIEKGSDKGRGYVQIILEERQFQLDLLARGKIRVDASKSNLPPEPEFPDFPY